MTLLKAIFSAFFIALVASCSPKPEDAISTVLKAYEKGDAVTLFDRISIDNFSELTSFSEFDDSTLPAEWRDIPKETIKVQYVEWFNSKDRSKHPYDPFFQILARRYSPADFSQVKVSDLAMNGSDAASVVISYPTARFGNTISFKAYLNKSEQTGWYINGISDIVNNDNENDALEKARFDKAMEKYISKTSSLFEEVAMQDTPTNVGSTRKHTFKYVGSKPLASVTLQTHYVNPEYNSDYRDLFIDGSFTDVMPGQEIDLVFEGLSNFGSLPYEQRLKQDIFMGHNSNKKERFQGLSVIAIEFKDGERIVQPAYWEEL